VENKTPGKPGSGGRQMFWKTPLLGVLLLVAFLSGTGGNPTGAVSIARHLVPRDWYKEPLAEPPQTNPKDKALMMETTSTFGNIFQELRFPPHIHSLGEAMAHVANDGHPRYKVPRHLLGITRGLCMLSKYKSELIQMLSSEPKGGRMVLDDDFHFNKADFELRDVIYIGFCLNRADGTWCLRIYFGSSFKGVADRKRSRFTNIRRVYKAVTTNAASCPFNLDGLTAYMLKYGHVGWHMLPIIHLPRLESETGKSWTARAVKYEMFCAERADSFLPGAFGLNVQGQPANPRNFQTPIDRPERRHIFHGNVANLSPGGNEGLRLVPVQQPQQEQALVSDSTDTPKSQDGDDEEAISTKRIYGYRNMKRRIQKLVHRYFYFDVNGARRDKNHALLAELDDVAIAHTLRKYHYENLLHVFNALNAHTAEYLEISPKQRIRLIAYLKRYLHKNGLLAKEKKKLMLVLPFKDNMIRLATTRRRGTTSKKTPLQEIMDSASPLLPKSFRNAFPGHGTKTSGDGIHIAYKTSAKLSHFLLNGASLAKADIDFSTTDAEIDKMCACNSLKYGNMDKPAPHSPHICTTTVPDKELQRLCSLGLNFRPNPGKKQKDKASGHGGPETDPKEDFLESIIQPFIGMSTQLQREYTEDNKGDFKAWSKHIRDGLLHLYKDIDYDKFNDHCILQDKNVPLMTNEVRTTIRTMQKHFVFTEMDKAANNVVIICKQRYVELMVKELNRQAADSNGIMQDVYEKIEWDDLQDVLQGFLVELKRLNVGVGRFGDTSVSNDIANDGETLPVTLVPYMRLTVKFHKQQLSSRYITSNYRAGSVQLSTYIHNILTFLQPYLKPAWSEVMTKAGMTDFSFPILTNTADVQHILDIYNAQWAESDRTSESFFMETFDIEAMYPSIPIQELKDSLKFLFNLAIQHLFKSSSRYMALGGTDGTDGMILKVNKQKDGLVTYIQRPPNWAVNNNKKFLLVEEKLFEDFIAVLLDNSYVRFGNMLRKQKVGIPMGTQCGPVLANWFAFYYEYKYINMLADAISKTQSDISTITSQPGYDENDVSTRLDIMALESQQTFAFRQLKAMTFYGRFIDDVLNVNYCDFQFIINAFPPSMKFSSSCRSHVAVPFLDALIHQSDTPSRHLTISLQDKRRDNMFTQIEIKQYTHWWSFLPRQIKVNIGVGQYYRLRRLLTDPQAFITELAIVIAKLVKLCEMPLKLIWPKIRQLLMAPQTRYMHGYYPRKAMFFVRKIYSLVRRAIRKPRYLKLLIESTRQRRLQRLLLRGG
jgi:hypothetical protein